jgi:hypothetical protein
MLVQHDHGVPALDRRLKGVGGTRQCLARERYCLFDSLSSETAARIRVDKVLNGLTVGETVEDELHLQPRVLERRSPAAHARSRYDVSAQRVVLIWLAPVILAH